MKIISYNVNGIRAALNKGLLDWLKKEDPDVFCIQESKAHSDVVDLFPFRDMGYKVFWHQADKKGYSGVAIFSKEEPIDCKIGCGIKDYDSEGRVIQVNFPEFSLINVYIPSGSSGENRQDYKMIWLDDFQRYIDTVRKSYPKLVICGDVNIAHKEIDIHNPVSNKKSSGFLPEERQWLTEFLETGWIDTFRHFDDSPHNYSWWSYRANARNNNKGWRIDYFFATEELKDTLKKATILPAAKHSDHCPISLELDFSN